MTLDPSILLLIVTAGLLVMLLMRGRRQQREQQLLQSRLSPGVEVMTSSGLFATVISVDDAVVVLETGPGQQSRWDRRAVARVVAPAGEGVADTSSTGELPSDGDRAAADDAVDDAAGEGRGNVRGDGDDTGKSKES